MCVYCLCYAAVMLLLRVSFSRSPDLPSVLESTVRRSKQRTLCVFRRSRMVRKGLTHPSPSLPSHSVGWMHSLCVLHAFTLTSYSTRSPPLLLSPSLYLVLGGQREQMRRDIRAVFSTPFHDVIWRVEWETLSSRLHTKRNTQCKKHKLLLRVRISVGKCNPDLRSSHFTIIREGKSVVVMCWKSWEVCECPWSCNLDPRFLNSLSLLTKWNSEGEQE